MKVGVTVSDLTPDQWRQIQDLPVSVEIPAGVARACVVFTGGSAEERHVELPARMLAATLERLFRIEQTAKAVLTPDALPDHLESVRNAADPARAAERTCEHGSPVMSETPSMFRNAEPVRHYADGCCSFGPYRNED